MGRLDSASGRLWFRPTDQWEFQVSSGRLRHPEQLEEGDIIRSTASASWLKQDGDNISAVTVAYGLNDTDEARRHAVLLEAALHRGRTSVFGRGELVDVETALLLTDSIPSEHDAARKNAVGAYTVGGVFDVFRRGGFQAGLGASVTTYGVPSALKATHGARPVSYQVFFRIRPPAGAMGRMWNMRMSQPMGSMPTMMHMDHQMD
jgi:hypothetical protein